jgi:hypothetical protein
MILGLIIISRPASHRPAPCPADSACASGASGGRAGRRIWEVAPDTTALATGLLLGRADLEDLVARSCGQPDAGSAEDALRVRVVVASTRQCALAGALEAALDVRSERFAEQASSWPMIRIADWWSRNREALSPAEQAALLWRLACAPGPFLEPLVLRVAAHLVARVTRDAQPHRRHAELR